MSRQPVRLLGVSVVSRSPPARNLPGVQKTRFQLVMKIQLVFIKCSCRHLFDKHRPLGQDGLGGTPTDRTGCLHPLVTGHYGLRSAISIDFLWDYNEPELRPALLFAQIFSQRVAVNIDGREDACMTIVGANSTAEEVAIDGDRGKRLDWQ